MEWGGANLALIDPLPPPEPDTSSVAAEPAPELPLPLGPLLFAVQPDSSGRTARALAVARLEGDSLRALDLPADPDERYRERFAAAFLTPGTELHVQSLGRRIGSLVLDGRRAVADAACPPIATGSLLLIPGEDPPGFAFALPPGVEPFPPQRPEAVYPDDRIRTFGPILAEAILRNAGEPRPFLAQRADLVAVPWEGDARAAMAATYLINDELDGAMSGGEAVSLFFLARFDPARGYVPQWSEVRRYTDVESREVYTWADALSGPGGSRIDVLRRRGREGVLFAASVERVTGDRAIEWTERPQCGAEKLLPVEEAS